MLGSRAKIALLTGFFTFTFALLFLALQNYVNASENISAHTLLVDTSSIQEPFGSQIFPQFSQEKTPTFDFVSDDSFQKYLSNETPFIELDYVPVDLVPINSNFTANDSRKFKLRQEAGDAFADMAWHFWNDFNGDRLAVFSAYRSKSYQDGLLRAGCNKNACAKGGTSEHQAGLAVDLRAITKGGKSLSLDYPSKYADWLKNNAATFGFHNTYQKGVEIDGKIVEGWHRRYLGKELAKILVDNDQTIAEYYNSTNKE